MYRSCCLMKAFLKLTFFNLVTPDWIPPVPGLQYCRIWPGSRDSVLRMPGLKSLHYMQLLKIQMPTFSTLKVVRLVRQSVGLLITCVRCSCWVVCRTEVNSVVVTTPPTNDSELQRPLVISIVLYQGSHHDTGHKFTYRSNPTFTNIGPRNHLIV